MHALFSSFQTRKYLYHFPNYNANPMFSFLDFTCKFTIKTAINYNPTNRSSYEAPNLLIDQVRADLASG